jgi:signal-transduction protein with cAMP-binding, CBS, and nucleotidyltransferase domain
VTGEPADTAVELRRRNMVRRLPVVENGRTIGTVSLGDLAVERDPQSVVARSRASSRQFRSAARLTTCHPHTKINA